MSGNAIQDVYFCTELTIAIVFAAAILRLIAAIRCAGGFSTSGLRCNVRDWVRRLDSGFCGTCGLAQVVISDAVISLVYNRVRIPHERWTP